MIFRVHPEGAKGHGSPSAAAMDEVLVQKSLLGVGVLLAWLVLVHLLVNIWLLCVLASLLVVFGGWLTSQAILESSNLVHLERFISLEQSPSTVEDERQLDEEIHNTVKKIIRDFVTSWFATVSSESTFEREVHTAMISMAAEMKTRAGQVDRKELTQRVLDLFGRHLRDFIQAKELVGQQQAPPAELQRSLWTAYARFSTPHLAVTDRALEVNYTRAVVDLLLHVLVPSPHLESRTGRFVVGELITCNVLLPFFAKLSDPDWLNCLIIQICSSPAKPDDPLASDPATASPSAPAELAPLQEAKPPDSPQTSRVPPLRTETEMTSSESAGYDGVHSEEEFCPQNTTEEESGVKRNTSGSKSNLFYLENDSGLESHFADCKQISADSLAVIGQEEALYATRKECSATEDDSLDLDEGCPSPGEASSPRLLVGSQPAESVPIIGTGDGTASVNSLKLTDREGCSLLGTPSRELLLGVEHSSLGNLSELSDVSPLQSSSPVPSFSFDPLSSPDGPVIIQNLRITGTITAKEHRGTGSHPYTLYTIKYETAMGCGNPGGLQPGSDDVEAVLSACEHPSSVAYHTVNRRYSEFLNLQTRLEEKAELRKMIKGVKGPKKMFPDMPFGNMDSDKIEARKGLLETFLKQLCTMSEIANSEEMQEFLALNTDARIAFVKKPFIVSRIDKIVVNAIVDTLKTAFPRPDAQSPTEDEGEVDGLKLGSEKKSRSRLRFSGKNVPFMNGADIRPVQFSCEQRSTVFNRMSLGELETFITEQEKLASGADPEQEESPEHREVLDVRLAEKRCAEAESETALAEVALNILCLLIRNQWSWLCTENMQNTIRVLFGTLINRWLDVSVANLTCTRSWVVYLQVIQEAVWPGGKLPEEPASQRSQQQRADSQQEALRWLMRLLPELLSSKLDQDKYQQSWGTLLDSLQNPHINRHLVFCLLDLLLELLVPEASDQDFQSGLLQKLSRNPEKTIM